MDLILTPKQNEILVQIEDQLQANKIRVTKGRHEILRVLLATNHPTFNEIVKYLGKLLPEKPNVMSVYNTINMLLAHHIIYANTFDGKQICYEVKIREAGHLKCDNCQRVIHLDQLEGLNRNFQELAGQYAWTCDHYKVEIHGLCRNCQTDLSS